MNSRLSSSDQAETLMVVMTLMQSMQFSFHLAHRSQDELIYPCVSCVFQIKSSNPMCGLFCYLFKTFMTAVTRMDISESTSKIFFFLLFLYRVHH